MDAKQRRIKARHDNVVSELEEAKNTLVTTSRDLLYAQEQLQPVQVENEEKTKELHVVQGALQGCRTELTQVEKTARDAVLEVRDLTVRLGEVEHLNEELRIQCATATKLAEKNRVAAEEVPKLRRRLANRSKNKDKDNESAMLNRKAATIRPL